MKILATADIHNDENLIKSLSQKGKDADVIVLAGDLTVFEGNINNIVGPLKKANKPIIMIPGNHESPATVDFLERAYKPGVYNLHAKGIKIGDVGFIAYGCENMGYFNLNEEEIENSLEKALEDVKGAKKIVLVTHIPPYDTLLDNLGLAKVGSKKIREFIEKHQPDICLCGHIHETAGLIDKIGKTKIINVGFNDKIIEI